MDVALYIYNRQLRLQKTGRQVKMTIDNRNRLKSHDCKENVLEMIDQALEANSNDDFCQCQHNTIVNKPCTYCKINSALHTARACIVASVGRIDVMRANMIEMQAEIEGKLKAILEG